MNHLGTQTLNTQRLLLRRVSINDANMMFNNWASNDNVTKYLTWPTHKDINITKMVLSSWIEQYQYNNFYQWGIVFKESNELIGTISVVRINEQVNEVEVGYCIGEKWWNQSITSEALKEVIKFLFMQVNVNKIEARHDIDNIASGKVMVKCGLKFEGTLRQKGITSTGKICDLACYSILKEEYI